MPTDSDHPELLYALEGDSTRYSEPFTMPDGSVREPLVRRFESVLSDSVGAFLSPRAWTNLRGGNADLAAVVTAPFFRGVVIAWLHRHVVLAIIGEQVRLSWRADWPAPRSAGPLRFNEDDGCFEIAGVRLDEALALAAHMVADHALQTGAG